jgi:GDP-L-fucose synthase
VGSGIGIRIRDLVELIVAQLKTRPRVVWDTSKPAGDRQRVMDTSRATSLGFQPSLSIEQGIRETMGWYRMNRDAADQRYNVFTAERAV